MTTCCCITDPDGRVEECLECLDTDHDKCPRRRSL